MWILISLILLSKVCFSITPKELLEKADRAMYPENATYISKMTIYRGDRVYEKLVKVYIKGDDKALIELLEPKRDRGIKILKLKDACWMYLPSVSKTIRAVGGINVMGGDFIYDDILSVRLSKDYEVSSMEEMDKDFLLVLKAKGKGLAYDMIRYWIDKENYLPKRAEFYGIGGERLIKILDLREPKMFINKLHPSLLVMQLAFSKDYKTTLEITSFNNDPIPDRIFTKEYMKKGL